MPHISPEDINRIADFESYRREHGFYIESSCSLFLNQPFAIRVNR